MLKIKAISAPIEQPKKPLSEEHRKAISDGAKKRWDGIRKGSMPASDVIYAEHNLAKANARQAEAHIKLEEAVQREEAVRAQYGGAAHDDQQLLSGPAVGEVVAGADLEQILSVLGLPKDLAVVRALTAGYVTDLTREMLYAIYILRSEVVRRHAWKIVNNSKIQPNTRVKTLELLHTMDTDELTVVSDLGIIDAGREQAAAVQQLVNAVLGAVKAPEQRQRILAALQQLPSGR